MGRVDSWYVWYGWYGFWVVMMMKVTMSGFLVATMIGFFLELNVPPKKQFEPSVFGLWAKRIWTKKNEPNEVGPKEFGTKELEPNEVGPKELDLNEFEPYEPQIWPGWALSQKGKHSGSFSPQTTVILVLPSGSVLELILDDPSPPVTSRWNF